MKLVQPSSILITIFLVTSLLLLPVLVRGECTCHLEESDGEGNNNKALKFKLGAIASILVLGAIGFCLPLVSKIFPSCQPGSEIFFMIQAFTAGVILAIGFIHVLSDAFLYLTSPCLKDSPWGAFPFTGFISMMGAIGALMVDTFATGCYKRKHLKNKQPASADEESHGEHVGHVHVHTHATHSHAHGADDSTDQIRHRVVSQVLELGIVGHLRIIGFSLGTSKSLPTVKTLLIALSFYQFFEGMALGGCISQAKFKSRTVIFMGFLFAISTPFGIALGIGISNIFKADSPTAFIVAGCSNSVSAGILIYMALVNLMAANFMTNKVQSRGKLQVQVYIFLLAGAGSMSLLAKWV